jgi:protocatechuate 3,4-dioxygenase beta subunit
MVTVSVTDGAGHALSGVDVALLRACPFNGCSTQPVFSATKPVDTVASQTTGLSGRTVFRGLRPGHYVACALAYYAASSAPVPATGFADKCASGTFSLTVTRGQPASTTISLDPGAAATGLVHDSHGNPLPDVAVHIGRSAAFDYTNEFEFHDPSFPSPRNDIRTDATGHYTIRSIMPGTRSVCGAASRQLAVRRTCLSSPATLTASTSTQEPTLVMNAAMHAQRLSSAAPVRRLTIPTAPLLPEIRRIPVINSTGWPEFRLLPRSKP